MEQVQARVMRRAAQILGSEARLRELLRVSSRELARWIAGDEKPPLAAFLQAVDVVCAASTAESPGRPPEASLADVAAETLHDAIAATGSEMGNVQLRFPDGLRIVAQRGFELPFLDYFARVDDRASACGIALKEGRRVVVPDVAADPLFADTPAGRVLSDAQVRAVQSTPLLDATGTIVGVLSTHCTAPRDLTAADSQALDRIAGRAAARCRGALRGGRPPP